MNKNPLTLILIAVVVIVGLYGAFRIYKHFSRQAMMAPTQDLQTTQTPSSSDSGSTQSTQGGSPSAMTQADNLVQISSTGFSPQIITIHPGQTVTWVNIDNALHKVNSDPHPTHTLYPPLNTVGLLNPGDKKSLSFPTAGTYKYHDHLNPSFTGQVVVQ